MRLIADTLIPAISHVAKVRLSARRFRLLSHLRQHHQHQLSKRYLSNTTNQLILSDFSIQFPIFISTSLAVRPRLSRRAQATPLRTLLSPSRSWLLPLHFFLDLLWGTSLSLLGPCSSYGEFRVENRSTALYIVLQRPISYSLSNAIDRASWRASTRIPQIAVALPREVCIVAMSAHRRTRLLLTTIALLPVLCWTPLH